MKKQHVIPHLTTKSQDFLMRDPEDKSLDSRLRGNDKVSRANNKWRLLLTIFLIPFVIYGLKIVITNKQVSTVRAFAHLLVDMGVPSGDPIFVVDNMLPGDCTSRTITVENSSGDITTDLSVRSKTIEDLKNLSNVLNIEIQENNNVLYSNSLNNFFDDSQTLDGVPLSPLPPQTVKTFEYKICFIENANNDYQSTRVIFDLMFGEVISPIKLPAECKHLAGKILFVVEGTPGDDDLRTEDVSELILGYGGNDELDGQRGDDCIVGGEGIDEIDGGRGNDVILGGLGNDILDGESGNDIIYGNEGNDDIEGGQGNDIIYGGAGNDTLDGRSGNDKIYGGPGDDFLDGGSGDDFLDGEEDTDEADGGSGVDECIAEVVNSCEL